ncbi:hypothetical protein D3C71_1787100 [compost metagenome]
MEMAAPARTHEQIKLLVKSFKTLSSLKPPRLVDGFGKRFSLVHSIRQEDDELPVHSPQVRKPLSKPLEDERPRLDVGFIANKKAIFGNRKLILSYVVKKSPVPELLLLRDSAFFVYVRLA